MDLPTGAAIYGMRAYYVITFCCFTHVFVDLAYKKLTMALSPARNLLRPNLSLNKSPNRAMLLVQ